MTDDGKLICRIKADAEDKEAFGKLFIKYYPIVRKIKRLYFVNGLDDDDFDQEARLVMYKSVIRFSTDKAVSFGTFYRMNLKNRIFDLIRANNAQKRLPDSPIISLDVNHDYYESTVGDRRICSPESLMMIQERMAALYENCSVLEKQALEFMMAQLNDQKISEKTLVNAFERCKKKYRNI